MEPFEPLDLSDFEKEAATIVARARETAREALLNALAEAERIVAQARERGIEEGRAAGGAELRRVADELERRRADLEAEAERALVRLAAAIAGRIVKAEIALGRPVAEANLREAISLAVRRRGIEARLHPDDFRRIAAGAPCPGVVLVADPSVDPGGVVVRTADGDVDARIATQLAEIERSLLEG